MATKVQFRSEQRRIIDGYSGGKMGIAAVPGSGKTFTLSYLAARLVGELTARGLTDGLTRQEVLIVTFTNSAVNSFRSRIAGILQRERGLLPYIGYRVRTLHGLAHDIVRERPALVGLSEDFQIVDEQVSLKIINDVTLSILPDFMSMFKGYVREDIATSEYQSQRIERKQIPEIATTLARQFIQNAKNNQFDPQTLSVAIENNDVDLPLARFGLAVYTDYQRSLNYRGAVDFDDLVRMALFSLQRDEEYCARIRERWPFILEDEAQDSSRLQEEMLYLLSGNRNWVRVGDPNQAINTTFTTADPKFLREFLTEPDVREMHLRTSGRSALTIIELANALVHWTANAHPALALRDTFLAQDITPTKSDDPQVNPATEDNAIYIHYSPRENVTPDQELAVVAGSIERFMKQNPGRTVAALAPENSRGYKLAEILRERGVPYEELLRSTTATREAASILRTVIIYLGHPLNQRLLALLYQNVWCSSRYALLTEETEQAIAVKALSGCRQTESFLWPSPNADWLEDVSVLKERPDVVADLTAFRERTQLWLEATRLPVDQLVLTITQDLFTTPSDIALGHKIAIVLRGIAQSNPNWRLPEFAEELRAISENQRKFVGFDDVEHGYDATPEKVTIATMHASKGLEWDRVYLLGVSNYGFPSAQEYDNYISEKWFVRDSLNLEAEAYAQLETLISRVPYSEGTASHRARLEYCAERLRLFYVGITRARRNLMITWNMGRFWEKGDSSRNQPALPVVAVWEHLQHMSAK